MQKTLLLEVTNDEFELPLGVYDSIRDLMKSCGYRYSTIINSINKDEPTYRGTKILVVSVSNS